MSMTQARLVTDGARPAVRLERALKDPPASVWRALTDRQELRRWFPCEIIVEGGRWVVGASLRFPFPAEVIDVTLQGQVLEYDEPRRLAFTWGEETLRFELLPRGEGTLLLLTDELPAANAARNSVGWEDCLDRLDGATPSGASWHSRFDVYAARYQPVVGPQDGPPAGYKDVR